MRGKQALPRIAVCMLLVVLVAVFLFVSGFLRKRRTVFLTAVQAKPSGSSSIVLTNREEIVRQIRRSLKQHDQRIKIFFHAKKEAMSDVEPLTKGLMEEALADTNRPDEGDYLRFQYGGYTLSYGHKPSGDGYDYALSIAPKYYTWRIQDEQVTKELEEIRKGMHFHFFTSDREKIRKIYDWFYDHVTYDRVHEKNTENHLKTTAYAAICEREAVCQGYCVAMYRMLREEGIDCRIMTGQAVDPKEEGTGRSASEKGEGKRRNTEYHSWILVRLGDFYYNIDVTWDKELGTHAYYLRGKSFFKDHKPDAKFTEKSFTDRYPVAEEDADRGGSK
ncbi:MAG: hypothetical protein HXK81_08800 [Lachnospiraceae bacterium]|nr:hypothetical protein [Lachnospiraceae bacterium]